MRYQVRDFNAKFGGTKVFAGSIEQLEPLSLRLASIWRPSQKSIRGSDKVQTKSDTDFQRFVQATGDDPEH